MATLEQATAFRSAVELAAMIRERRFSAEELLDLFLARVQRYNPQINAIIQLDEAGARARARDADAALRSGTSVGPLHGVPITVKESFDIVGMPTTWGLEQMRENFPAGTAAAVERLRGAGAIVFGKTNVPVRLADWQTFNSIYGVTRNPWDLSLTPGGSSGGSAAALAAGLTALELGSDIGASIRGPAHFCGVYGHKPTFGVVPYEGHALPGGPSALDIIVAGPLARSADDLMLAMEILAGPEESDSAAWTLKLPQPAKRRIQDYRIAVMTNHATAEVDGVISSAIERLGNNLAREGAQVDFAARPAFDPAEAHEVYLLLLRAATSAALTDAGFESCRQAAQRSDPKDKSYFAIQARGNSMSHRDWIKLDQRRREICQAWQEFFVRYDLMLCPPGATTAFPHNHQGERWERMVTVNGKPQPSTTQMFWAGYSGMAYLPSTVAPIGPSPQGLPVGVQIIGPLYGDLTCVAFAQLIEKRFGGFVPPPSFVA